MKPKILILILAMLVFIGFHSCKIGKGNDSEKDPDSPKDTLQRLASPVETADAVSMDMHSIIRTTGSLEPYQTVNVLSKVQGMVESVHMEQGDIVKNGDILLKLDSKEFDIALKQAEADLLSAKASLNEAELQRAENQYKRIKELYEKDLSSPQELEQQEALFLQAKSNYESQQARILSLSANYERARLNLSYTTIRSPIAGVISRRFVNKGELLSPSSPVCEIVNISKLYARIYVSEKFIHYLDRNKEVEVIVDAVPENLFFGRIDLISPVAETQSRTFQTSILIDNSNNNLKAGMFARVIINVAEFKDAVAVPKDAVIMRQDQEYCFIIKNDDKKPDEPAAEQENESDDKDSSQEDAPAINVSMVKVRTGIEDSSFVQIIEGVKAGDKVIVSGHYDLNDGDIVRIIRYVD